MIQDGLRQALKFNNATSDVVTLGSGASLDNIRSGTLITWMWVDSYISGRRIYAKHTTLSIRRDLFLIDSAATPSLRFTLGRATANTIIQALLANFAAYGAGKWICAAVLFNADGANGDQRLLIGDEHAPLAEPSSYVTQDVGSGTTGDDSSSDAWIGNSSAAGSLAFPGKMAAFQILRDYVPSRDLLLAWQQLYTPTLLQTSAAYRLGANGGVRVLDESGCGNHGSIAGPTLWAGAPLQRRTPVGREKPASLARAIIKSLLKAS